MLVEIRVLHFLNCSLVVELSSCKFHLIPRSLLHIDSFHPHNLIRLDIERRFHMTRLFLHVSNKRLQFESRLLHTLKLLYICLVYKEIESIKDTSNTQQRKVNLSHRVLQFLRIQADIHICFHCKLLFRDIVMD